MAEPAPIAGSLEDFQRAEESRPAARVSGPRAAPATPRMAAGEEDFTGYRGSRSIEPTIASTLMAPIVGANIGVAETFGLPVDIATGALNLALPERMQIREPFGGSESIMRGMGYLGADPRSIPPRSTTEHYLQSAGRGAGSAASLMFGPAAAVRAGAETVFPRVTELAKKILGEYRSAAAPAANIAAGAGGEAAGEVVRRVAPETSEYAPIVPMLASIAGGMGTAGAAEGFRQAAKGVASYVEPMYEAGRRALAARGLLGASEKPETLLARLQTPDTFLPGTRPTVGQIDRGVAQLEKAFASRYPEFEQRYREQNAVRADALNNIQRSGNPTDLSAFIRREFDALDSLGEEEVKAAVAQANQRAAQIGGELNPEDYGKLVRDTLQTNKEAARTRRNALYDAIDPNKELNVVAEPIRSNVENFYRTLSPQEIPPSGEEANILNNIVNLPDVMRFADLTALDTRITEAMKAERATNGETRIYGRLIEMKNAVQEAIFNSAENQANFERRALEQGQLTPDTTMEARLRSVWGLAEPPPDQLTPNLSEDAIKRLQDAKSAHERYAQTFRQGPVGEALRTTGFADNYRLLDANVANLFFRPGVEGFERAQAFRRAVGDNPQAVNIMQDYAASSLRRAAEQPDGTISPEKFAQWADRHRDALRAFPDLERKFADAASASETVAQAISNRVKATSDYEKSILGTNFMNLSADADVTNTVGRMFNRRDAVRQFTELASAARQNPDAYNGLRKSVADFMVNRFVSPSMTGEVGDVKAKEFVKFIGQNLPALRTMFSSEEINGMINIASNLQRGTRALPPSEREFAPETRTLLGVITNKPEQGLMREVGRTVRNVLPISSAGLLGYQAFGPVGAVTTAVADAALMYFRARGLQQTSDLMREALLNPGLAAQLIKEVPPPGSREERTFLQTMSQQLNRSLARSGVEEIRENQREPEPQRRAGGRVGRASGGRLMRNDHAARAAALIRAAEAAKKAHNATTEGILEQPDEAVAKALSIANKAI